MKKIRLSSKRQAWAEKRKVAPVFRGEQLHVPSSVGIKYAMGLRRITRRMIDQTHREVLKLFRTDAAGAHFGQDASISSQARILLNALSRKFDALFVKEARPMAEGMLHGVQKASATALTSSLSKLAGGMTLKAGVNNPVLENIYKASVAENVALIKSIPSEYLGKVQGSVMRSITTGNGLQDLVPALEKYDGQTERRATNIALDQTRKAYNSTNKGRMQAIGVKKFQWHHSGGGTHPREDHEAMDGMVYSFDDLPVIDEATGEQGIPGQAPNCRCTMSPVFDFGDDE